MLQPVLVTGASSGIGLVTCLHLARQGFRVIASMRNPDGAGDLRRAAGEEKLDIELLALDVTSPASVKAAVDSVIAKHGVIGSLVSNAGIQVRGYFEDLDDAQIREVYETNVFGTMNLIREILPHMRERRQGRIVLVSSTGGKIGTQGLSSYCSSKFALEGFGECMALETAIFGIHVSLIEPGIINTEIWHKNLRLAARAGHPESPYREIFQESERLAEWALKSSPIRSEHVAVAIHKALTAGKPNMRYMIGWRPRVIMTLRGLVPGSLFDRLYTTFLTNRLRKALPQIAAGSK